ncbi:TPA: hypothetical protein I8643_003044 [Legionella pneumophila]|nr:hypothetical protein [Legionella pneumophila]
MCFSDYFLSCLCGSERKLGSEALGYTFLSCLCGSEQRYYRRFKRP